MSKVISCPACKRTISVNAKDCPSCDYSSRGVDVYVFAVFLAVVVPLTALLGYWMIVNP